MLVETLAFALIGLIVGAAALVSLPAYFPGGRALTAGTALVAALLGGVIMHFTLDGAFPGVSIAVSAIVSGLLTSVLARPDLAAGRLPAHRHHPHRVGGERHPHRAGGAHRRHRHA
ncbi:hypothetical protein RMN57_24145 [Kitasatospora sp. CM 4170]|uniref:Uncharacterized protein n=1 Tax=Kitasatospora aburaviensis TaxID=67265 RepID=A0ABW1FB17_9ACTN|nr:hypothetical protein [Kitasatospora sp. CM 4170]WNM47565.1 hypothetical protein RMN57_24145 [Kitasatospora sp. CM 4170]